MSSYLSKIEHELSKGNQLSIVGLIEALIHYANESRASDIHIDPTEGDIRIRLRIDGVLNSSCVFPKEYYELIISRLKILANLRTDEHQAAQDGRFRSTLENNAQIDIRVSIVPSYHGESAVLRLLTDTAEGGTLDSLGYSETQQKKILSAIHRPHGMILCTGPTGSGKTTMLYTLLKLLNNEERSIITIEDPIEYGIKGITQIQVNSYRGLTFASGLRSILRQDPNIIMVGEIRDSETAAIAINTALTGHLIFSTLHTSNAVTTLPRLLDMGIESYLIASTVNLIIGQRLVRKSCRHCKERYVFTQAEKESLWETLPTEAFLKIDSEYRGKGCEHCKGTGFSGRVGINEVLIVDEDMRTAILTRESAARLTDLATSNGMVTMLNDACYKVQSGQTTMSEVLRIAHD